MNKNILEYRKIRKQAAPIVPQTWAVARRIWKEERIKFINYLTTYNSFMRELPESCFIQGETVVEYSDSRVEKTFGILRQITSGGEPKTLPLLRRVNQKIQDYSPNTMNEETYNKLFHSLQKSETYIKDNYF